MNLINEIYNSKLIQNNKEFMLDNVFLNFLGKNSIMYIY